MYHNPIPPHAPGPADVSLAFPLVARSGAVVGGPVSFVRWMLCGCWNSTIPVSLSLPTFSASVSRAQQQTGKRLSKDEAEAEDDDDDAEDRVCKPASDSVLHKLRS